MSMVFIVGVVYDDSVVEGCWLLRRGVQEIASREDQPAAVAPAFLKNSLRLTWRGTLHHIAC